MRIKIAIAAVLFAAGVAFTGSPAGADPISCPAGQTAVKTSDFWACENNGGNFDHSGDSNNPNGNPNFYR
jgi:hypothetical protein